MMFDQITDLLFWALASGGCLLGFCKSGGGGSAPAYPVEKIKKMMDEYIADTKADIKPFLKDINKLGDDVLKSVDKRISDSTKELDAEEKQLLDRLKTYGTQLRDAQSREDASLLTDLGKINKDFEEGMSLLDARDKEEFQSSLRDFQTQAENLTSSYDTRATDVIDTGDTEVKGLLGDYKTESMSLGDSFLQKTGSLGGEYKSAIDEALSLNPERLAQFTQAADFLSQAALKTRMDMLATADPRALELSALADENAAAMMSGRIGADVQANLARSSAMRALQGGFGAGSEMGRGLTARDLGLTSMDLMTQGARLNESQRRLNFDTRVAGLQADSGQLLANDMTARERQANVLYETGLRTAESDRNQRQQTLDTTLGGNLARVDTRIGRELGVAGDLFNARMDTNRVGFGATVDNQTARSARQANTLANTYDTDRKARSGIYDARIGTERSIYGTNVNSAGNIFSTQAGAIGQRLGVGAGTIQNIYGVDAGARTNAFNNLVNVRTNAATTNARALDNAYAADVAAYNARQEANNSMWGSLVQTGATLAGAAIGTIVNPGAGTLMGAQIGGAVGGAASGMSGSGGGGGGASNILGSLGSVATSLVSRGGASPQTMYNSLGAVQSAAPYATSFSSFSGMGYVPKAGIA
jgi:hypothetical protein